MSGFSFFGIITIFFWFLIFCLCFFILIHLYIINRRESNFKRWKYISDTLIRQAIFFEEDVEDLHSGNSLLKILEVGHFSISDRLKKLLPDPYFRKLLTAELLSAKQNMSGTAASNLKDLFRQLKLDNDAYKMLDSRSWNIKAIGIQQFGIMEMNETPGKILKYTDNERGLIRVEAQNTLLKFYGFEGLRFLDHATYPISEWQQIKMLEELAQLPTENFTGIEKWLKSENDTVVIFALKLAKVYHRFELYEDIMACFKHKNPDVRFQAILATRELQKEDTANDLITYFNKETERNKIAIVNVLADTGSSLQIPFLLTLLNTGNNTLTISAANSLASIGIDGLAALRSHPQAKNYPLDQIIKQIEAERQ